MIMRKVKFNCCYQLIIQKIKHMNVENSYTEVDLFSLTSKLSKTSFLVFKDFPQIKMAQKLKFHLKKKSKKAM